MAKLAPGVRLLRSLARAAKAQRVLARKLLAAAPKPPKPPKPPKSPKPAKPPVRPKPARALATAPGKWMASRDGVAALPGHPAAPSLSYWLYLPNDVPQTVIEDGWPLVVMLHGCHQSATQFAQGTRMNRLAEAKGYAVLYPQQSVRVQAHRCWRWYERAIQQGDGETAALAGLIETICRQHPIDRRRIYACGLSAGAGMAAVLALNHPQLIAAVGLHSGPVFGAAHGMVRALDVMRHGAPQQGDGAIRHLLEQGALPPMPAILIHGDDDQVVRSINQAQLARQWLQLNGLATDAAARVAAKPATRGGRGNAHEVRDYLVGRKVMLRVASIAGLGHAWSGGDPALKFNAAAGPDASRMMLDFFGRHRR